MLPAMISTSIVQSGLHALGITVVRGKTDVKARFPQASARVDCLFATKCVKIWSTMQTEQIKVSKTNASTACLVRSTSALVQ